MKQINNQAFTLIELLVVVLIIGILAAIAVPQYQTAVEKSRYSTLKRKTIAIAESVNRYQLATGNLPREFGELDISLPDITMAQRAQEGEHLFSVKFKDLSFCHIWIDGQNIDACFLAGYKMGFYFHYDTFKPHMCYTLKANETCNKVCQQETGKKKASCSTDFCSYLY